MIIKIKELVTVEELVKYYTPQSLDDLKNSILNDGLKEKPVVKEATKETNKEATKETTKETPIKAATKTTKAATKEASKEASKEATKEVTKETPAKALPKAASKLVPVGKSKLKLDEDSDDAATSIPVQKIVLNSDSSDTDLESLSSCSSDSECSDGGDD